MSRLKINMETKSKSSLFGKQKPSSVNVCYNTYWG